jgi:hypothetical protein
MLLVNLCKRGWEPGRQGFRPVAKTLATIVRQAISGANDGPSLLVRKGSYS